MGTLAKLSLFAGAHGGANGAYQGFIALYLRDAGLDAAQVGLTMGAAPLVSLLAQPAWGAAGDRAGRGGKLLALMATLSGAALLALPLGRNLGLGGLLAINAAFAGCFTALQPMGDAQILRALGNGGGYGRVKLWAGLAFALASLAGGYLARRGPGLALALAAALLGLTAAAALGLPGQGAATSQKGDWRALVKLPYFLPLLLPAALAQMALGYFYTFFPVRFDSLWAGQTHWLGAGYVIGAASEVPLLLSFDKLFGRWGARPLLTGGALLLSLRLALLAAEGSLGLTLAGQALSGAGACALTAALAREVGRLTPPHLKSRGQTLASALSFALARALGNLTGGRLTAALGLERGFLLASGLALTASALFWKIARPSAPPPRQPG